MTRKYRFRILKNPKAKQRFHYVVLANNHEIVQTSENYVQRGGAINAAKKFIKYMLPGAAEIENFT